MNGSGARIRVGVVLDSLQLPAWQFAALESIVKSDCADLVLVALSHRPPAKRVPNMRSRAAHGFVHSSFLRIEDARRRPTPDACAAVPVLPLVQSIERVGFPGSASAQDEGAWLASVRERALEVLLVLAECWTPPFGASLARWGHWHHACEGREFAPADGSMVGFGALIRRHPFLSSSLQVRMPESRSELTAYQTRSAIDYHSHYVTRNEHLWKCSTFVLRALRKCHEAGGAAFLKSLPTPRASGGPAGVRTSPARSGEATLTAFLVYFLWRAWRKLLRRVFTERWVLMFGIDAQRPSLSRFRKILPPAGRFWADPHVVAFEGRHHVFFEDASVDSGIGHIALLSETATGEFSAPKAILKRPYHLSYPFLFRWHGDWYLLPESAANRTVELYRCVSFPDTWEFRHNLLENVEAYDPTLVEHGGRWWLFANIRAHPAASTWDELHVFHADTPVSRSWTAHHENPVLSDVTRARPAGPVFPENGRLIRPSQNSSSRYGHGLQFNEIVQLDERLYAERTIAGIEPAWWRSIQGVHTISRAGRITFVDAILRARRSTMGTRGQ